MIVLLLVTLALIVGLVAALLLARGRVSLHAAPATTSMGGGLPAGPVTPADIEGVRFDTVVRGYRMDQVDEVLERLESELIAAHDEIRMLRADGATGLRALSRPAGPPRTPASSGASGPSGTLDPSPPSGHHGPHDERLRREQAPDDDQ